MDPGTPHPGGAVSSGGDDALQLPIPAKDANAGIDGFSLSLRATRTGLVACPQPLLLLSYTPEIVFTNAPSAFADGELVYAAACGDDIPFSVDRSRRPGGPLSAAELAALPFSGIGSVENVRTGPGGELVGGVLRNVLPGVHGVPWVGPPEPGSPPLRSAPPVPPSAIRLVAIAPELVFGRYTHFYERWRLRFDPVAGRYASDSSFPLDTPELQRMFFCLSDGTFVCGCTPEIELGVPPPYDRLFATNAPVAGFDGIYETAEGTVAFAGRTLWTGSARHRPDGYAPDSGVSGDGDCDCGTVAELDGTKLASVGFRVSLGQPRAGQISGFLWFRSDDPVSVAPGIFQVLARSDSNVTDTTENGVRTVACSDARGRSFAISPVAGGVSIAVTTTATGSPDHSWEIVNENGDPSRIRIHKISRAGNTLSDETYVRTALGWVLYDPIDGTTRALVRDDAFADPSRPTGTVETVLTDASGLELQHTFVVNRRFGDYGEAVLREVERREDVGTAFEKTYLSSYWEASGERNGLPRLLSGTARAWSWTDYDDLGRPVLSFGQKDGSPVPASLDDGTRWTLSDRPAGLRAFATVYGYAPLSGDTTNVLDNASPRTVSRYVVEDGAPVLVSRTWTVYARGTTAGFPSVAVRTERAASQSASFGDVSNAVSVSVSVDPDASGVPLLLRGRPLSCTGEDGVTTAYDYAFGTWDAAARAFAAASGASHLRTRVFTTTPEAPNGIPLVSTVSETVEDAVHGNEVWSATRVLLADGSLSDPFDWEARVYDDQDRLRSTLYSDGSSSTNAYSCCRLLFTVDRNGMKRERLASTGTDHLRHAWLDVSFPSLPKNEWTPGSYNYAVPGAYGYERTYSFRATESLFDPLGREIRRRVLSTEPNRTNSIDSLARSNKAWESVETNAWPEGSSDFRIRVDARGLRTETTVWRDESSDETWTESYDGTNLLERNIRLSVRGGETESFRAWDSGWTDALSFSRHGPDGCRTDYAVASASDAPVVTNSAVFSDFLGRTMRVVTPLSDSTYAYDGPSSRVLSVSDSVSGLSTATLYDALREPAGSVSSGVASLSATRYEQASGVWWRVTESREAAG
ncbi:MAG: hypothetical protein IJL06_10510, partial [Kiritimatiellae bacterium]|nr:hypothetical protein [Kiritimatiellia bacterium]